MGPRPALGTPYASELAHAASDHRNCDEHSGFDRQTGARGWPVFTAGARASTLRDYVAAYRAAAGEEGQDEAQTIDALAKSLVTRHIFVAETDEHAWENAVRETRGATMFPGAFGAKPLSAQEAMEASRLDLDAPAARENPQFARLDALQSWLIAGSPDTVAAQIQRDHADLGIQLLTRFAVGLLDYKAASRNFELFVKHVMPQLKTETFTASLAPVRPRDLSGLRPA